MTELVQYRTAAQGYGEIKLNRPDKMNAVSNEMAASFRKAIETAKQQPIKFLVITASGELMFCAGGDLKDLHGDMNSDEAFATLYPMKEVLYEIVSFPVPTVCLLNGDAMGGGCEIATACDFRIAREHARFGFVQTKLGIIPGWGGGVLLYEKVHPAFAFQWLMEAEKHEVSFLHDRCWIQRVAADNEWNDRDTLLRPYLSKSLEQMKILKNQYKKKISSLSLSAQMDDEVRNCAELWETKEHKEAVRQFFSRK
ncbi:enoyl-CoA hydratase/isomerase family protein [Lentibacillus sp. CBA3610]|uniref:enoyl-CoA hydratase/isomerase family protein n=1 Tax=Lentibacillus sp. CBA3610 TaxID=2518176 RepID=UPI0015950686|nr:enoyl-CoA hydratase/isomerase family protein [Lentibacillus sp. CBA3610]QKY68948.1 enoyl-CoA hydratase/isomerase family protein [Lentibacillus sp. CBA3610]